MDFWDLTVVIFRRWKVSLPLLLIAIGATAFVAMTAKPDYAMTSYVQLIPAKVAPTDNPTSAGLRNPWNQLGLNTLGQASIYATQDKKFLDALKAGKHTDNFTLTMTYPNPIVTVEVVGKTPEDARDTTQLVISRLRESAESLQKGSGVSDGDMIATQRLDQGQNLLPSRSKVKRAILAVAAAGLVMTAGGTVAFDAFMRRRSRKRQELAEAESAAAGPPNGQDAHPDFGERPGEPMTRVLTVVPPEQPDARPVSPAGAAPSASMERTAIIKRTASVVKPAPLGNSKRPPEAATYRSVYAQNEPNGADHDGEPPATNGDVDAVPSDVRVVLQPKWVGGENGGKSQ